MIFAVSGGKQKTATWRWDYDSRLLLATSLRRAMVQNDDAGNTRLVKRGTNNCARDDAAAALVLAAGAVERQPKRTGGIYLGSTND